MTIAYEQMTQKPESHVLCDLLNCATTMCKLHFPMTKNNANVMLQRDDLCKGGKTVLWHPWNQAMQVQYSTE